MSGVVETLVYEPGYHPVPICPRLRDRGGRIGDRRFPFPWSSTETLYRDHRMGLFVYTRLEVEWGQRGDWVGFRSGTQEAGPSTLRPVHENSCRKGAKPDDDFYVTITVRCTPLEKDHNLFVSPR